MPQMHAGFRVFSLMVTVAAALGACSDDTTSSDWELSDRLPNLCENGCEPLASCRGELPEEVAFSWEEGHTSLTGLELEPTGCPRVLFEQGDRVEYAAWDGEEWRVETAAHNEPVSSSDYNDSSLAIGPNGSPSVGYVADGTAHYAWRDADGQWRSEQISDIEPVWEVFHEVAPDGRPAMLVMIRDPDSPSAETSLYYAERTAQGWSAQRIPGLIPGHRFGESLVFDGDGRPHIATSNEDRAGVEYAVRNAAGEWRVERLSEEVSVATRASLILDAEGSPHIIGCYAHLGEANGILHLRRTLDGWEQSLVPQESRYFAWCRSLDFDAQGRLHLAYILRRNNSTIELRHATWHNGEWQFRVLDAGRDFMRPEPRIAIDRRLGLMHLFRTGNGGAQLGGLGAGYSYQPVETGDAE